MTYFFDEYSLDADRRELRRGPDIVPVEPQVFDLLQHLIRNRDCVVSSDDLMAAIWNGRIVSGSTVSSRIAAARRAIGDSGDRQRLIATLPRKGHRFVGEVREERGKTAGGSATPRKPTRLVEAKTPKSPQAQAVTFCKTSDGFNLAISAVGEGPLLVRTTH